MSPETSSQTEAPKPKRGGTEAAIRHHYDLSNAFYALWLDETMTYSCALWHDDEGPGDLAAAQRRKLDFHLDAAGAARAHRLLDIGCGWGSLMDRALNHTPIEHATGLTLSDAQHQHILARGEARIELRKESWIDHVPADRYDSIVSVGALEHFASPGDDRQQKIGLYQEFFREVPVLAAARRRDVAANHRLWHDAHRRKQRLHPRPHLSRTPNCHSRMNSLKPPAACSS